jgi:HD-GYP domain-containing protein (c-di-GMP phosphodiesterase class II)
MIKNIKIQNLRVGMFVNLSAQWHQHNFAKNQFLITSFKQIEKIKESGIQFINIDTEKGFDVKVENSADQSTSTLSAAIQQISDTIMSDGLLEAVLDMSLPPHKKAETIHRQSIIMMKKLLEQPAPDHIKKAKQVIAGVVDLIFADNQTSNYLIHITSHDFYTYTHSVSVGLLATSLAKNYFPKDDGHDMHELGAGFFLHDLGKVKIDIDIINKPGKLSEEETTIMRHHPAFGYKILREAEQLSEECTLIVLQHHERFDGKGYPKSLKGDMIHEYGQICAIADIYDALTSVRPYRIKMSPFDALMLMKKEMRGHFNEKLFERFVLMLTK